MRRSTREAAQKRHRSPRRGDPRARPSLLAVLDKPSIADAAYDKLFRELRDLEEAHPTCVPGRLPTLRVWRAGCAKRSASRPHGAHALASICSLTPTGARVRRPHQEAPGLDEGLFATEVQYRAEPKFDGSASNSCNEDGACSSAARRGRRRARRDVTENPRTISRGAAAPGEDGPPRAGGVLRVRGEAPGAGRGVRGAQRAADRGGRRAVRERERCRQRVRRFGGDHGVAQARLYAVRSLHADHASFATQGVLLDRGCARGFHVGRWRRVRAGVDEVIAHHAAIGEKRDASHEIDASW